MVDKKEASNFDCNTFFFLLICTVWIEPCPFGQLPWNQWRWPLNWRFLMWTVYTIRFAVFVKQVLEAFLMLTPTELDKLTSGGWLNLWRFLCQYAGELCLWSRYNLDRRLPHLHPCRIAEGHGSLSSFMKWIGSYTVCETFNSYWKISQ